METDHAALLATLVVALLVVLRLLARFALRLLPRTLRLPRHFEGGRLHERWLRFESRYPIFAGWIRRRLSLDLFAGLPLTTIVAGVALAALLFSNIAEEVLEERGVIAFDQGFFALIAPLRNQTTIAVFAWITQIGGNVTLMAVAIVSSGFLLIRRQNEITLGLWVAVVGSQATLWLAKYGFDRTRPEFLTDVQAVSPSFPSGHTTGTVAVVGYLAYALARQSSDEAIRFEIGFWAAIVIGLVGFSRVFLTVHYLTDVLAGFLLGGIWLMIGVAVSEWRLHRPAPRR